MLGVFHPAEAGSRGAAARFALAALLACVGLTWTAGASDAFATFGTVEVTKVNVGGAATDAFHFDAPSAIVAGGFDLKGGQTYTNARVHANAGVYDAPAYIISERPTDGYEVKSIVCGVTAAYHKPKYGSTTPYGDHAVKIKVGYGEKVACTVTNQRKTGTITVVKDLRPATDAGRFDLRVDGANVATKVGDGGSGTTTVPTGTHTVGEAGANLDDYVRSTTCTRSDGSVAATGGGPVDVAVGASEHITCTITNTKREPGIKVVKSGPTTAYSGDTLDFGFDVTNTGQRPLTDVDVRDDHCAPVAGPVAKAGGDDDGVLEPGETWHYTCSYVATHALGDPNPLTNVVTAQATDDQGAKVEDEDAHDTLFRHPAIDIEKSGPATATAGALLTYTLDVTNPGDMPFAAADVAVTDARCAAAPALHSTNDDATPGTLDRGDRWTYACRVQTAAGQTQVVNVADVRGTDENGRVVTDEDTFTTTLTQPAPRSIPTPPAAVQAAQAAPAQAVAGVKTASRAPRGTAALRGSRACPRTSSVTEAVTGREIRRVTFLVAGKRVRTVTKADRNGRFTLTLRTASLRRGANSVVARVEFTAASRTRARDLRITVTRCAAQAVRPQFTG